MFVRLLKALGAQACPCTAEAFEMAARASLGTSHALEMSAAAPVPPDHPNWASSISPALTALQMAARASSQLKSELLSAARCRETLLHYTLLRFPREWIRMAFESRESNKLQ